MIKDRVFGTPAHIQVGQYFEDRREMTGAYLHRPPQHGISGTQEDGADSIVLSGGYSDDEDHGSYIIYTGQGGRGGHGRQIAHQRLHYGGNAALATSMTLGLPVRVTRKAGVSKYSPQSGYQYAGLYTVTNVWTKTGKDGFEIVQFRLDGIPGRCLHSSLEEGDSEPEFEDVILSRRIRDSTVTREVKDLYQDLCQICGVTIDTFTGKRYSEGAHIHPLGRPHLGKDRLNNILCLCPNHHVQLDFGGLVIRDDMTVAPPNSQEEGVELTVRAGHEIDVENVRYHRALWERNAATT